VLAVLAIVLCLHYTHGIPDVIDSYLLAVISMLGTVPVLMSAFASLRQRQILIDLLASVALIASLLTQEWASAAFINLMKIRFGMYRTSQIS
jgi:cation transport ATPase